MAKSEKTAYVVVSEREEMDVLANRNIQFKTRDTTIRGSDGRYYDLIHGVSVEDGYRLSIAPRTVYFDITSFMKGLASKRAVTEVAAAEAQ